MLYYNIIFFIYIYQGSLQALTIKLIIKQWIWKIVPKTGRNKTQNSSKV